MSDKTDDEAAMPPVSPSTQSQAPSSPRSVAAEVAAQLSGTVISLFIASKVATMTLYAWQSPIPAPGPFGIPRWGWGLLALVVIAVPTSAYQLRRAIQAILGKR